jgi:hypothetical protein
MDLDLKQTNLLALIVAVEKGDAFGSKPPEKLSPNLEATAEEPRPQVELSAECIQKILMGLPIGVPGEPAERVIKLTSAGLRIWFTSITGELNLEDLSGSGGGALPGLSFDGCWFDGRILLRRSHIRSLSLRDCRFTELRAAGAVFDGPMDLSGIRRPHDIVIKDQRGQEWTSRGCQVVLSDAQIGGHLYAGNAHFAAKPREKYMEHSTHAPYALDLRASDIRGSVTLRPGVEAVGGISMNLARIIGSVWCSGARLTATQERAFSADYAEIQGSLYMRAFDPPDKSESQRFVARGSVSLFATKLGGNLYMEGALLQDHGIEGRDESGEVDLGYQSLDLTNATVVGSCKLCYWQSVADDSRVYPFEAKGEVALRAASIGNDISLSWAKVRSVSAANIRVGGDCRMSVFHDLGVKVFSSSMRPTMTANAVHLEGAVIKGDLEMRGAKIGIDSQDKKSGIFARSARIGGNCHLTTFPHDEGAGCPTYRFECFGRIHMQEASVGNSFVMAGSKVVWEGEEPGGALDLSGTTIGGHAKFMTWEPDGSGECIRFEIEGNDIALRLAGTRIAQKLILNGALIRKSRIAIDAANIEIGGTASLSVYRERHPSKANAARIFCFTASGGVIFSSATIKLGLRMTGARIFPPDWDSNMYSAAKINDLKALDLELAHVKFALLRSVACTALSYTSGKDRFPFEAAGKVVLLHAEIDTDLDLRESNLWGRLELDHARVGASINLGNARVWCGLAMQVYEAVLANYENVDPGQRDRLPLNVHGEQARHHISKPIAADLSLRSARAGNALIVSGLQALRAKSEPIGPAKETALGTGWDLITVDLRGLHVEELRDEGGAGWGDSVRFWMDGFHYTRLTPEFIKTPDETPIPNGRWRWGLGFFPFRKRRMNAEQYGDVSKLRLKWLNLQYFDKEDPHRAEFTPGAYQQLVKNLNADGLYEEAREISFAKLKQENVVSDKRSRKFFWWFFRIGFGYGLSPLSAVRTFVLFLLLGSLGAWAGDEGIPGLPLIGLKKVDPVLFVNTSPPQTMIIEEQGAKFSIHPLKIKADKTTVHMDDIPCGGRINPILYALDVFIPVLDLRQQTTCSIAPKHWFLRLLQALYAVLGWVLTPLTLLTFSGILKRHLEN